ncbi:MAG: amino acid adenylation domain-containing protein [SAR324 cluster bacterium]|nr:amino acid adenylation domain-containing protein [SAR324 cluster bacterium]
MDNSRISLTSSEYGHFKDFWSKQLRLLDDSFQFTLNKSVGSQTRQMKQISFCLEVSQQETISDITRDSPLETFIILLSAYYILLSRYMNTNEVVVNTPLLSQKSIDTLYAPHVSLIGSISPEDSLKDLIIKTNQTVSNSYTHQNFPLDLVTSQKQLKHLDQLTNVFMTFDEIHRAPEDLGLYDFVIEINRPPESLLTQIKIRYNAGMFDEPFMLNLITHYKNIVSDFKDLKSSLKNVKILNETEVDQLLNHFNNTRADFPKDKTLVHLYEEQAAKTPDAIAVVFDDQGYTYQEINERANQLAHFLKNRYYIGPGDFVAIILDRSEWIVVAMLGILKAGGAYLPIEPDTPLIRIQHMLDDTRASVVLSKEMLVGNRSFSHYQEDISNSITPFIAPARPTIIDLDSIPHPNRTLIDYDKYAPHIQQAMVSNCVSVMATRGCPFKCAYCHMIMSKTHKFRTAEHIFEEIAMLYETGCRRFSFVDDIFNVNRKNTKDFFKLVIDHKLDVQFFFPNGVRGDILSPDYIDLMVEAGTVSMAFALETASPRLQKFIDKRMRIDKLNEAIQYTTKNHPHVITELFSMHGFPTETEEEAMMTLDFIKSIHWLDFPYVHMVHIYPNTEMVKLAAQANISEEAIERSKSLYYHEIPETIPFSKSFTRKYQAAFVNDYFLNRERLLSVLPNQMKVLTENEIVQKYDSYLPVEIQSFEDLLNFIGVQKGDLGEVEFRKIEEFHVPHLNDKLKKYFPGSQPEPGAYKILLLDLSQFFSHESYMIDHLIEVPLGLMCLLTYLEEKLGNKIEGKIIKSRLDFDNFNELKKIIEDFQPDLIGVRALSLYRDFFHKTISLIRQWGIDVPIVGGGPYASSSYTTMLSDSNIDILVNGEGEETFYELIKIIMDNDRKLPETEVLKRIQGIVFVENKKQLFAEKAFYRHVLFLEYLEETLSQQPSENLNSHPVPQDLAYVLYTSGSTGFPKGCLITHQNVVRLIKNDKHLFDFNNQDVWIMAHSYSFDFSVWELYGAMLYGGMVVIPLRDEIQDTAKFLGKIKKYQVTILNQTPPAFINFIKQAINEEEKRLDDHLRYVIFGGDKFEPSYMKPWVEVYPLSKIQLINMYGITETTVHVSFCRITESDIFSPEVISPLGHPIPETTVYICDENMNLLPVGVPGEMYVGGTGLGKGYLNQPELTSQRFISNPFEENSRLYKTGDLGRWLSDGSLEYLGRNDDQVQIRGFRVELGEIKARILEYFRVQDAFVTAKDLGREHQELVAYLVSNDEVSVTELRVHLKQLLPDYMIPAYFVPVNEIPLTPNNKVDRKALPEPIALSLDLGTDYHPPRNELEQQIAIIWQEVLGHNRVGIHDNYFALGGDSIKAIQVVSKFYERNLKFEIRHLFKHQTIAELVQDVVVAERKIDQNEVTGIVPLTAIQTWFFEQYQQERQHYNQSELLVSKKRFDPEALRAVLTKIQEHHDALRIRFRFEGKNIIQEISGLDHPLSFEVIDLRETKDGNSRMNSHINSTHAHINLEKGPLMNVVLYQLEDADRLLMVIHHLVIDGVSWRILSNDIAQGYHLFTLGKPIRFNSKTDSFKYWSEQIRQYCQTEELLKEKMYWNTIESTHVKALPRDFSTPGKSLLEHTQTRTIVFSENETGALLTQSNHAFNTQVNDLLLTALARTMTQWHGDQTTPIMLEGHGREAFHDLNISRTVGWFTTLFPVILQLPRSDELDHQIKHIKELLRKVPNKGMGYGLLRYLSSKTEKGDLSSHKQPLISFNYLGQFDEESSELFRPAEESSGDAISPRAAFLYDLEINGLVANRQLEFSIRYNAQHYKSETIDQIGASFKKHLVEIVLYCRQIKESHLTPSDIDYDGLNIEELEEVLDSLP